MKIKAALLMLDMERKTGNDHQQWPKSLEHSGLTLYLMLMVFVATAAMYPWQLTGTPRLWCEALGITLMSCGGVMVVYTDGSQLSGGRPARVRRWGWRILLLGTLLGVCVYTQSLIK